MWDRGYSEGSRPAGGMTVGERAATDDGVAEVDKVATSCLVLVVSGVGDSERLAGGQQGGGHIYGSDKDPGTHPMGPVLVMVFRGLGVVEVDFGILFLGAMVVLLE